MLGISEGDVKINWNVYVTQNLIVFYLKKMQYVYKKGKKI